MKVIHIIPCDGIGGVEVAAKKMLNVEVDEFQFELFYVVDRNEPNFKKQLWNPFVYIRSLRVLLKKNPDVVVLSLWRSVALGLMLKMIRPNTRIIYFLHSNNTVHFLDDFFTKQAIKRSTLIFCDSKQSLSDIVPSKYHFKAKIISFVTNPITKLCCGEPSPAFIFWGRLSKQKNLFRTINLFALIKSKIEDAHLTVIGPDEGELEGLINQSKRLALEANITFTGSLDLEGIKSYATKASFYLQTSEFEGMAMSVVEAMQMGLVPVVTSAGEIGTYCNDGENAIIIKDDQVAVEKIEILLNDIMAFENYRNNAIATWANKKLYVESLIENLVEVKKNYYN